MRSPLPITFLLFFLTIQTGAARDLDDQFPGFGKPNRLPDRAKAPRHDKVNPDQGNVVTVPHWSGSYIYQKLTYNYTMVGTDPKRGSATTRIPTVLIPIRFVFEDDGTVMDASTDLIDGRTAIEGIVNSPIFKPYSFNIGGTNVGHTQFGDAFQRAEFWDSVSTTARDYHVILEPPVVAPAYEVRIPAGGYHQFYVETNGRRLEFISPDFLYNATVDAINQANVSPGTLPIVIWGNVAPDTGVGGPGTMRGFHGAYAVPGGVQTFIAAGYHPTTFLLEGVGNLYEGNEDINSLSRAVVSWLNDPFRNNYTPGWNRPGNTYNQTCESGEDLLEVDAVNIGFSFLVAGTPLGTLNTESGTYHVADAAFLDYFTRAPRSRSVNRQYGFFSPGVISGFNGGNFPSPVCTGHIEVDQRTVEFPGASRTQAFGINNKGWIVGDFRDAEHTRHGFLYDGQTFTQLDYPGSASTVACKVNDNGQLVGFYTDAAGLPHGYSYSRGKFTPIDFPGSIDHTTMARGINSRGDIVGLYDTTAEITHGFIYQNGRFRTFDTPFGSQTEVLGINDQGDVAGFAYDIGDFLELTGFSSAPSLRRFNFPGTGLTFPWAINNLGMLAGTTSSSRFYGVDGLSGFVTIYGYPYEIRDEVFDLNDKGQIVGNTIDPGSGRVVGYIATLPK